MAVERLTDYTRRIWTGLGPDAPEGHDIQVNDVIYYMDSSECCIVTNVHPDGSIDCETLPDIGGGGGGGGINLRLLGSGTYTLLNGTTRSFTIPVSTDDNTTRVLIVITAVDKAGVSASGKMIAWYRFYNDIFDYLPETEWPAPQEAYALTTNGAKHQWVARTSGNENNIVWDTGDSLGAAVIGSGYWSYSGDYEWKIWGY